jgi:hypothetical protein
VCAPEDLQERPALAVVVQDAAGEREALSLAAQCVDEVDGRRGDVVDRRVGGVATPVVSIPGCSGGAQYEAGAGGGPGCEQVVFHI